MEAEQDSGVFPDSASDCRRQDPSEPLGRDYPPKYSPSLLKEVYAMKPVVGRIIDRIEQSRSLFGLLLCVLLPAVASSPSLLVPPRRCYKLA